MSLEYDLDSITDDIKSAVERELDRRMSDLRPIARLDDGVKIKALGVGMGGLDIAIIARDGDVIARKTLGELIWENRVFGIDCVDLSNSTESAINECRAMIACMMSCKEEIEERLKYILSLKT